MWELDHKEDRVPKDWCFWTVVLKTLESPLDCKEIQPVNPKGNQSWIFIKRTDTEAEAPILWPPDAKSQQVRKDPDAGKDRRLEEKEMTEDELVGCHNTQWAWVWASSGRRWRTGKPDMLQSMGWQSRDSDTTEQLNNKIKTKSGVTILTTFIQHNIGSSSHSRERKEIKGI